VGAARPGRRDSAGRQDSVGRWFTDTPKKYGGGPWVGF
jgi:hypothetical protein